MRRPERSRVPGSIPTLQERLGRADPWRVAVICVCLNRAGGTTAAHVLEDFFRRWPNAWALDADLLHDRSDDIGETLSDVVRPLGFLASRTRAIRAATDESVEHAGMRKIERVAILSACVGIGPYARFALRAFCLGDVRGDSHDARIAERVLYIRRVGLTWNRRTGAYA